MSNEDIENRNSENRSPENRSSENINSNNPNQQRGFRDSLNEIRTEEEKIVFKRLRQTLQDKAMRQKILIVAYVFIAILIFLICRVGYIKYAHGEEYEKIAVQQQTSRLLDQTTNPLRGKILDRNGKTFAISNTIYTVVIDIASMYDAGISEKDRQYTIDTLSTVLKIDKATVESYYALDSTGTPVNNTKYKIIAKEVSYDDGQALLASGAKGIYLEADSDRVYPQKQYASSVIGFMRGDDASTYWGLEAEYDKYLQGEKGRNFMSYTENGDVAVNEVLAKNGDTIVTTLDLEIQNFAEEVCAKYGLLYNAEHAGAIVMNPNTGEILAMAQFPTFDANAPGDIELFNDTRFKEVYEAAPDEEKAELLYDVWKNFNIAGAYEPGSVYKPQVVAAALDEGIIKTDDIFVCNGSIQVADRNIPCWKKGGHGELNAAGVLANSCNVGMILIGEKLGRQNFYDYQRDFGFGEATGIDLPGEETSSANVYSLEELNPVEVATGSMGQGFNATSIQMATAFAAIINGGYLLEPYVVSRVVNNNHEVVYSNERTVRRQVISKSTSDYLRKSLRETITDGTGKKVNVEGYTIGGKTGTAQQNDRTLNEYVVSFEGYFPVENPQYLVYTYVYKPTPYVDGQSTSTLMAKEIIEYIIQIKGIEPSDLGELKEANEGLTNKMKVPNLTDMSVQTATKILNESGSAYEIIGNGSKVVRQIPPAGSYVTKGSFIYLYVESIEGEELVLVPNVIGLTGKEAEKVLKDAGFEVTLVRKSGSGGVVDDSTTTEDIRSYYVKKQMPSDNLSLPRGTNIRLEVEPKWWFSKFSIKLKIKYLKAKGYLVEIAFGFR